MTVKWIIFHFVLRLNIGGNAPWNPALLYCFLDIVLQSVGNDWFSIVVHEHAHCHTQKQRFASLIRTCLQAITLFTLFNTCTIQKCNVIIDI